jgi:hypothetical protein
MSPGQWRRGVQAAPKDEAAVTAAPLH